MVAFDTGTTLADRFRVHAGDQTHLYGHLLRAMADDWESGGPVREICAGYEDARPGSVIQLRLLAGLFRIVLAGRAPELVAWYPCLGGTEPPAEAWAVVRPVLAAHVDELHAALALPPQTNEVGRSAALLAGLFDVVAATGVRRVRLLELGASAGLNLLLPWYWFGGESLGESSGRGAGPGWSWGPADSPVRLTGAVAGLGPSGLRAEPFEIVSARGCDPDPIDAATPEGRLLLTSYVWPFHLERHARLAGALQVAATHPPAVERGTAAAWLAAALADPEPPADGGGEVLDVVWHSISRQYWPPGEVAAVTEVLAAHTRTTGQTVARVEMEYLTESVEVRRPELRTTLWSPGLPFRVVDLGTVHDHGIPVWLRPSDQKAGSSVADGAGPA